ncbi:MAG: hypothetical protein H7A33_06130 [Deltaproteobacteria bacterium]|nr:hypothetical protein [Deltaproteobacteria bacterium]
MRLRSWIFGLVVFCCFIFSVEAFAEQISGLAQVQLNAKRIHFDVTQAILLTPDQADFLALDDFGGALFRVQFKGDKLFILGTQDSGYQSNSGKLKKILSLPVTQKEFLQIMNYQKPEDFLLSVQNGVVIWESTKKNGLRAKFSDFRKLDAQRTYPRNIVLEFKKRSFRLSWTKLKYTP